MGLQQDWVSPLSLMAGCKVRRGPRQAQWMWGWAGGLGGCCLGALPPSGSGRACGHLQTCGHNSSAPGVPIDRYVAALSRTPPAHQSWSRDLSWLPPLQQLGWAVRFVGRCWRWGVGCPGRGFSDLSLRASPTQRPGHVHHRLGAFFTSVCDELGENPSSSSRTG